MGANSTKVHPDQDDKIVPQLDAWYANLKRSIPSNEQIDQEVSLKLNDCIRIGNLEACNHIVQMHPITVDRGMYNNPLRIALERNHEDIARWLIETFSFRGDEVETIITYLLDTQQHLDVGFLKDLRTEFKNRGSE